MATQDTKKLISFSSPSTRNLIESIIKERCEVSKQTQSAFIECTLIKELLPSNSSARFIVEKLYDGTSLAEAYIFAIQATPAVPANISAMLMREFYQNISILQPRFDKNNPSFQQVIFYIDNIAGYLNATAEEPHFVETLKEDLEEWPELTPIMFCIAPILANWEALHRSGAAISLLVACAEIAAPKIVDTPRERISFIDALKHW